MGVDPAYVPGSIVTPTDLACDGRARIRKHLLLGAAKEHHLVLSQYTLCCYPLGNEKTPFTSIDLSSDAVLKVGGKQSFTIRDQGHTTYHCFFASQAERNKWLVAFQHVGKLQRSLRDYYSVGKTLGRGACGQVSRCTSVIDGREYAVKEGLAHNPEDYTGRHGLMNELQIMQQIALSPHSGLPALVDAFRTRDGMVQIVMELMEGRNICSFVASSHQYCEHQARDVFREITEAVQHLHSLGISHRDLKPENLVFDREGDGAHVKVLDFNLAKSVHQPQGWKADTPCGTSPYIAPEVLSHQQYSQSVDMWSLGCTLYLLLSGQIPFRDLNSRLADGRVVRGEWNMDAPEWAVVSEEAKILVKELLTMDPDNRHTADKTLRSRWLSNRAPMQCGPNCTLQNLHTPAALRRMRGTDQQFPSVVHGISGQNHSKVFNGSPTFSLGGSPPKTPRQHQPGIQEDPQDPARPDSFSHINAWLDDDLQALRLQDERRGGSEDGRPPPEHHEYGSPRRISQVAQLRENLQFDNGAGLQDHNYIDAQGGSPR